MLRGCHRSRSVALYADEKVLICPTCHAYFRYRRRAPGGSEDVLHTTIDESIEHLSLFGADQELRAALAELRARDDANPNGLWRTLRSHAEAGVAEELAWLRLHSAEVIPEILDSLGNRYARSQELEEWLGRFRSGIQQDQIEQARERDASLAAYRAEVLAEYLLAWAQQHPTLPAPWLERVAGLLEDHDPAIRQIIATALVRALDVSPATATLAHMLLAALESSSARSTEAGSVREASTRTLA